LNLLGALLISAAACVVLNLLGLAIGGSVVDPSLESWAIYGWMVATSLLASWAVLITGKFWESQSGEHFFRRVTMVAIGTGIGVIAFLTADLFEIKFSVPQFEDGGTQQQPLAVSLTACVIGFAVLFGLLRWWMQASPLRSTRLSIVSVGLALAWGAIISQSLGLPLIPMTILVVVMSIAIQIAAPWFSSERRLKITRETLP